VSGVVALLAGLSSRPTDGWFLWLVPAGFMLTRSPSVLFDVSFQLSFAAVAGLLLLARPLTHAFSWLPRWLGEPAAITTAASVSTAPVSMATFGQTSLVAVPANIAGGFVLGPIMFCGMLSVFAGFVWPGLSVPLNLIAGLFTGFLLTVAAWFAAPSFAVYQWRGLSLGFLTAVLLGGALEFIEGHFAEEISREDAARAAGLSPSHFSHLMRAKTGWSFTELLTRLRIDRASHLLAHTDLGIVQIALECGFGDQSYFTRLFRRRTRQTPGDYRASHRPIALKS